MKITFLAVLGFYHLPGYGPLFIPAEDLQWRNLFSEPLDLI
jgi:hypothetical protein